MSTLNKSQKALIKLAKESGASEAMIKDMIAKIIPSGISGKSDVPCKVTVSEYKGKPTMTLLRGESSYINKPFTFGKAKAQMIVEQYEAIKAFSKE